MSEPITVFGAEKVIDFTYVDDCIDGIVSGIEHLLDGRVRNETFNLAYGEGRSLSELIDCVRRVLDREPEVIHARPRRGEVIRYVANLDKARALLDFSPKVPLEEGIRRAVAWGQQWSPRHGPPARSAIQSQKRQFAA